MCLAVIGQVTERVGEHEGRVDLRGNRVGANFALAPEAAVGDYVLLHAGFAIRVLPTAEALETLRLLDELRAANAGIGADAEGAFMTENEPDEGAPS
jgi:hydrogenase expression/formation protein HypC